VIGKAAEMAERLFVELEQLSILVTSREGLQVEVSTSFDCPRLPVPPKASRSQRRTPSPIRRAIVRQSNGVRGRDRGTER